MSKNTVIFKNIISLYGIQGISYLLPLFTLPYLTRVLEPQGYGNLGFSLAIIQYFCLFVDYGFNLSATKQISINRNNKEKVSEIFFNVYLLKIILCLVAAFILLTLTIAIDKLYEIRYILYASYLLTIGTVIFPTWFFQGLEKMGKMAVFSIIARVAVLPLFFIYVKEPEDVWVAALFSGLGSVIAGVISTLHIYKSNYLVWKQPKYSILQSELKESWHYFISVAATSLYTTTNIVIIGFMLSPTSVALFIAADKVKQLIFSLISPIGTSLYPQSSILMQKDIKKGKSFLLNIFSKVLPIILLVSIIMHYFSNDIVALIFGSDYSDTVPILQWLLVLPVLVFTSNILGVQIMLPLNFKKEFSRILILSGVFNIISIIFLIDIFGLIGAAISVVAAETLVTISMYIFLKHKQIF